MGFCSDYSFGKICRYGGCRSDRSAYKIEVTHSLLDGRVQGYSDTLVACIDTGACNFSDLPLMNITEIMSISLATIES